MFQKTPWLWFRKTRSVTIADLSCDVVREMLRFMYTGERPEVTDQLLVAADRYGVKELKVICEQALTCAISVDRAAELLYLADRCTADLLMAHVLDFIKRHDTDVMQTDGWKAMMSDHWRLVLLLVLSNMSDIQDDFAAMRNSSSNF